MTSRKLTESKPMLMSIAQATNAIQWLEEFMQGNSPDAAQARVICGVIRGLERVAVDNTGTKQQESLTAKLECIACNYRNEVDVAIHCINTNLENKLNELVEEFGYKAVDAAVDATADANEDNLTIDCGPYPSLYEAFDCVPTPEPYEECENAELRCPTR